jgi:uncharacterized glyoxalase superfamily protein PhnB
MTTESARSTFGSAVSYLDPKAALRWLEDAFGFETTMVITDEGGNIAHSEMKVGDGFVMVAPEWTARMKSPKSVGGVNTQCLHVQLAAGIDAHCERARQAGAVIEQEPEDQFYGDRTYRAIDPEGHMWTFAQTMRIVSNQEMEAASGLKIRESL